MSLRNTVLSLAVLCVASTGVFAAADKDWTMTRYDESQCGYTPQKLDQPLTLSWQCNTTKFAGNPSTPAVVNGVAYFASGNRIYAVDSISGGLIWTYPNSKVEPMQCNIKTGISISDKKVYFGGTDGSIYALNCADGKLVWTFPTRGSIRSTPIVSGGSVFCGSDDNNLYAVKCDTGEMFWPSGFRTQDDVMATPAITPGIVIFTSMDTYVYAANVATGKLRWTFRLPNSPIHSAPVVSGNMAYIAAGNMIYALSAKNGQLRYTIPLDSDMATPPAVAGTDLYILCRNKKLYAFTVGLNSPKKKWENPLEVGQLSVIPPTIAGDVIYIGGNRGMINGYSCEDGKLVWSYTCAPSTFGNGNQAADFTSVAAPIVAADGALLVLTDDGSLRCFRNTAPDNTAPKIFNVTPEPASAVSGQPPLFFSAILYDESTGVDPSSVKMYLDDSTSSESGPGWKQVECGFDLPSLTVSYQTPVTRPINSLSDGRHYVKVEAKDWKGNLLSYTWSFMVDNALTPKPLPASYKDKRAPTSIKTTGSKTVNPKSDPNAGGVSRYAGSDAGTPPAPPAGSSVPGAPDSVQ